MSLDFRDRFHIPKWPKGPGGSDCAYLCGHSLGLQPKTARRYIEEALSDWETLGVDGHFRGRHPWVHYNSLLAEQTARLVGAKPMEVVAMNSLTMNLHLMMLSFYRPVSARHRIVIEEHVFGSDQYAIKSQIEMHGYEAAEALVTVADEGELEDLLDREGESVALILMGGVNYFSGRAFDLGRVTRAGHAAGCLVGFDLAHAAGNLVLKLHEWGPDFAAWCTYKYLNGGPGSIGGCFVHERHARNDHLPRLAGWWGHEIETRFQMSPDFRPSPGAEGWQVSNPPVVALAALRASLDIFDEAGMERLRARSLELTGTLEARLDSYADRGFSIATPRDPARRGAQLSISVPGRAVQVCDRLREAGVVCDSRGPDTLRVAPAPLYNTMDDVDRFVDCFLMVLTH